MPLYGIEVLVSPASRQRALTSCTALASGRTATTCDHASCAARVSKTPEADVVLGKPSLAILAPEVTTKLNLEHSRAEGSLLGVSEADEPAMTQNAWACNEHQCTLLQITLLSQQIAHRWI